MRILFDQNVPVPLRAALRGHQIETAYERGWSKLSNGDLVSVAESEGFDILITTDQNITYQQNWSNRKLFLLVLSTNDWSRINRATAQIQGAIDSHLTSNYLRIEIG